MLGMAMSSARLMLAGKLFKDNRLAMRQLAKGAGMGAALMLLLGLAFPPWVAAIAGGAAAGWVQPILFKDLKFA